MTIGAEAVRVEEAIETLKKRAEYLRKKMAQPGAGNDLNIPAEFSDLRETIKRVVDALEEAKTLLAEVERNPPRRGQ